MTLPVFSAALDAAAVGAMVSVVGTYTLDALRDSDLRAQHKHQCAERLKMNDGGHVPYSDQAILANLDWGIDSLEEAITTNNVETKVARLDHAEKMLQVCALLDSRAATAGVPNCYLSAWAHFNIAFVWKLRNNDRKAANHMLDMFLVDPFYSRVDFAPKLWEHLFLSHLSNVVNWYMKQRKSIVVSGTVRNIGEEQDFSVDVSRDFTSNSVNVLDLSAGQTAQLQTLEGLYQDSLDENTRQYARYYKDWLNYDVANKKGMPLMPIAEPPMTPISESWVPPKNFPTGQTLPATEMTMPLPKPVLLGQVTGSSMYLSRNPSSLPPLQEYNDYENPEFEIADVPTHEGPGPDDDPDSPNSNFRKPGRQYQDLEPTSAFNRQSESSDHVVIPASADQNTSSEPRLLRSTVVRQSDLEQTFGFSTRTKQSIHKSGEIRAGPNSGEVRAILKSGEMRAVPHLGEIRSVLDFGEIKSISDSGESRSVPNSGEIRSIPNVEDMGSVPNSAEIRSIPNVEDMRSVPKVGETRSASNLGEIRSTYNSGELRSVPGLAQMRSIPNRGEIRPASNSGELRSGPNSGEIRPVSNSGEIRVDSSLEALGGIHEMQVPTRRRSFRQQPNALDYFGGDPPTTADRKLSEQSDNSSSPKSSQESPRGQTGRRASRLKGSSSSRFSNSEFTDRKLNTDSELNRHSTTHQGEGLNENSNASEGLSLEELAFPFPTTPTAEDSIDDCSLRASTPIPDETDSKDDLSCSEASASPQIQEMKVERRQKSVRDSDSSIKATGIEASSTRTRFFSKYGNNGSAGSSLSSRRFGNDDDEPKVAHSGPLDRASGRYKDDDDEPVAHSGPLLGRASERFQDDDDEPNVAHSGPLLGRNSQSYQYADHEPNVGYSGPLLGRNSQRYQDDDSERKVAFSGPLLGRVSPWYQTDNDEPRNERVGSGSPGDQGRSRRHWKTESRGSLRNSNVAIPLTRPPKDFVCPITNQLFNDPVTLETGQTYERKAIQEWVNRGKVTCPITRQKLKQNHLPKTNYVLKRVVDSWKEQCPDLAKEFGSSPFSSDAAATIAPTSEFTETFVSPSVSPDPNVDSPAVAGSGRTSRHLSRRTFTNNNADDIAREGSPVDVDGLIMDLKPAMSYLCTSENLAECESVMLEIARLILQARGDQRLVSILNSTGAITGMMELLYNSQEATVLNVTLFLLSVVISKDDTARQTVLSADPEAGCLVGLLRRGLTSSAAVLYELKLPNEQLTALDLLPLLVVVIKENEDSQGFDVGIENQDIYLMMMKPKSAAIMLLDQIVTRGDPSTSSQNAQALLALQAVPALVSSFEQTNDIDVQTSLISLLLRCIKSDGRSRNMISKITNVAAVVDLLHSGSNTARTAAITFLNELVHLSRRAFCADILEKLKAEGSLSSMRILLVYLQMAPLEHRPAAASLLLQLDLLAEPRKGSIYREEAVDSLVEALISNEWPCPAEAANALIALGGRFSYSGKPMMKAWLLKIAGIDKYFLSLTKSEQDSNDSDSTYDQEEEERAAKAWEKKVAGALLGHDLGTLIEALGQGIQSKNAEVSKPCMIVATWLTHMLPKLPDTGVRQIARNCLLDHFVGVLQTPKDLQQRVLAALAIHSFISDPEGVQELISYVKDISGPLRHLKKSTWTAKEILRAFTAHGDANTPDLWVHAEQGQLDVTANGEVRALVKAKTRIFSGHSDGTIKVWDAKKRFPVLLQELKEHSKSVMALTVLLASNRMYSGSLDKSIRVWALGPEDLSCVHVIHLKDAVMGLLVNGPMACIIPQGAGLKVQYEETTTILNANKHVQSLATSDGKVFCGCADNSLQELDPVSESVDVIQHGVRKLMGKKPIYATQVFQDHLYGAGTPIDGVAGKVWKLSDHSLVGTICTTSEVRSMAISEDFIYLGSSSGLIEVWLRERLLRVSTLNPGSKVICLMLDGDTLYSGHEDGKIRIWTMI